MTYNALVDDNEVICIAKKNTIKHIKATIKTGFTKD